MLLARIIDGLWKETVKEWQRGTKASKVATFNRLAPSHANKAHNRSRLIPILNCCNVFSNAPSVLNDLMRMGSMMWNVCLPCICSKTIRWKDLIFGGLNSFSTSIHFLHINIYIFTHLYIEIFILMLATHVLSDSGANKRQCSEVRNASCCTCNVCSYKTFNKTAFCNTYLLLPVTPRATLIEAHF